MTPSTNTRSSKVTGDPSTDADQFDPTITELLDDVLIDARKVVSHLEQAARDLRLAEHRSACDAVERSNHSLDRVHWGRAQVLRRFEKIGVSRRDAASVALPGDDTTSAQGLDSPA